MYSPKKLELNKFKSVKCPCPRDLYQRIGPRVPNTDNFSNDGSSYSDLVDFTSSSIQMLEREAKQERMRLYDEYSKAQDSQIESEVSTVENA